jgi:choline kinase
MKAVIVAAGRSSRLYPLTLERPKCLLEVGGQTMIERSVGLLHQHGIDDIVVVVGFCHEQIRAALGGRARFVLNPFYAQTNNMASLWLAMPHLGGEEFVYLHADVVYHADLLKRLLGAHGPAHLQLLTDFDSVDAEAMKVRIEHGWYAESSKAIPLDQAAGEWIGLTLVRQPGFAPLYAVIEELLGRGQLQDYDTEAFNLLARAGHPLGLTPTGGLPWYEIDTQHDLARARRLFAGEVGRADLASAPMLSEAGNL